MPPSRSETLSAPFAIDEARHTIRFARLFDAPAERVFEAWTTPEQIAVWWDPSGARLSTCEVDLRAGGSFRFVSPEHPDMPFSGVYREIAPPRLIEFEAMGAIGKVMLDEQQGGTRMTVEIACRSADHLAQFVQMGVADGTSRTLDNLVGFVR